MLQSYQYNFSMVTTPMWLQRLLVQSLSSLTAPPRNVPSLWVIFGQAWWQLGTEGQEQSSEKLGQDAASKTCPPPVLKPSLCVIKCFYSSRETFLRDFLCQILCGADTEGPALEVYSLAGWSHLGWAAFLGMQEQLSLCVQLELIKALGKEAQEGCIWWICSASSVVGG